MTEFGIFNDEGLVEGEFYSEAEAQDAARRRYADEDMLVIAPVCGDHHEHQARDCEACACAVESTS